ncbi:FUSC family protein [Paeniclostridium sp. NSJ-45]|uniref:FUSC family protein n=1 Tax=Paeniclostridium hominis TaxID=2764329 RepID=A0ABR7K778_9FIRM|nr:MULTISPECIES: FUSC family protein [Paeniclostridium]MBC6004714.1 FUSC family protein [Paeniclostridium hominis]
MKSIISKTLVFMGAIPTAIFFKCMFGTSNMLVGITGFMAAVTLMENDYTANPIRNTLRFILIELFIGLSAFISSFSAPLTLIFTFIVVFFIVYIFTFDTSKPIYMPFIFCYLFMLYMPVKQIDMPNRIEALILSGILIMLVQMLVNKNKFWNKSKSSICKNIDLLIDEINILLEKKDMNLLKESSKNLNKQLQALSQSLYSRKEKTFLISDKSKLYLCIVQTLEGTNIILEKSIEDIDNLGKYDDVLVKLKLQFNNILKFMNEEKSTKELKNQLNEFIYEGDDIHYSHYISYELRQNMTLLRDILDNLENGGLSYSDKKYGINEKIKEREVIKRRFNRNSLRFTFAFRIALLVSLGAFVVDYFDLYKGKWMVFTLSSVVQPYIESSETKMIDRIKGSLIGILIFELLFHLVPSMEVKMLIAFTCGYIGFYFKDYSKKMIFMTVFALSMGATNNDFNILSFDRLKFILIGCVIAFVANRIIFPYKIKDVTKNLVKKSVELNNSLATILENLNINNLDSHNLRETILTNRLTNDKININNNTILSDSIGNFLNSERIVMSNLRVFKSSIKNNRIKNLDISNVCNEMQRYINGDLSKDYIIKNFDNLSERDDKLIFMNIYEIFRNIDNAKKYANEIAAL